MMLSQKTMFLAAICFESYKYVNASCIVMPNEISYAYGTTCKRKGFPDNLRCQYDYPYAEQILRQTVLFYGRSTTFDSCHSTKVCCENTYDDGVPDNPIKVKELYQDIKYTFYKMAKNKSISRCIDRSVMRSTLLEIQLKGLFLHIGTEYVIIVIFNLKITQLI